MQSVGTLLDNQTGANNASIFDPMTGHEGGVTPAILLQFTIAAVFAAGGFVLIVDLLYFSYTIWPIKTMLPLTGGNWAEILIKLSTEFWRWIVVYGAPLVGSLILLELGLALISRGAPSLDLFSFSLPAKSFFAYLVLYLMCSVLVQAFVGIFSENGPVRFYLQRFVSNG
jgi:type III secretion protein T